MSAVALCALLMLACGGGDDANTNDNTNDAGMPQTPVPGPDHTGYQNPACGDCHNLPVEHHYQTNSWECAGCHGGNGACDPLASGTDHQRSSDCQSCHGQMHGNAVNQECVSCHFAYTGLADCNIP